jgi:molybdate transport system permease protein
VLPVVAIFLRVPPRDLVDQLSNPVVADALRVSFETSVVAQTLVLLFGTPTAYLLASRSFRGRGLLVTLVEVPLVLPPAVAGIGLFAAFGRLGLLGSSLSAAGIAIPFTPAAVVLAVAFVAGPLYVRQAIAAFEAVDDNVVAASRTLGAGPTRTFFRVVLPLARVGLAAGLALSFARGLGEFGATITFVSNIPGETQTLPLAIYTFTQVPGGDAQAVRLSIIAVVLSIAALAGSEWLTRRASRSHADDRR